MKRPLEIARNTVHQWDNHDKYRQLECEGTDDPPGVAMARSLVAVSMRLDEIAGGEFCRLAEHMHGLCDCQEINDFIREVM